MKGRLAPQTFVPSYLNSPGGHFYQSGTLGLDLPLYEGGSRVAQHEAQKKATEAKEWGLRASLAEQYSEAGKIYATLLALSIESENLEKLQYRIKDLLFRYHIGAKSNPVGYSGLLGLKTLKNRIIGILQENCAKQQAMKSALSRMAEELPEQWAVESQEVSHFINVTFAMPALSHTKRSAEERALYAAAEATEKGADAEKSKFLPRIGVFASGNLYAGSRGSATSYASGGYLQWDLFSASNYGALSEAHHIAAASVARAEAQSLRTRIEWDSAVKNAGALEENLSLMGESTKLLEEQTDTSSELFRSGAINALQLVEVLSRRADLLISRTEMEINLAKMRANILLSSDFNGAIYENN